MTKLGIIGAGNMGSAILRGMLNAHYIKSSQILIHDTNLEKLEAMTAVCSVGLDMIVVPGNTSAETISGIIADEAAIGMVNSKTTAVRIIPAIGKKAGEELDFGGLLGKGPVMEVRKGSSLKMIRRGGRIPAPLQSLKN